MKLARVLGGVGRTMITAGTLILLFVVYQLWGTNIHTARQQNRLEDEFTERLADTDADPSTTTTTRPTPETQTTAPSTTAPTVDIATGAGEVAGRVRVDEIGLDYYFVEGVTVPDLKKGPGHYPDTPFPGQAGNAALAGHRTTYGAPFNRIDELAVGDKITIETVQGTSTYEVFDDEGDGDGYKIVSPRAIEVLDDFGDNRLTLTTCNPKYSARQRLIVVARLVGNPLPRTGTPLPATERAATGLGLSGEHASKWPALWWGLLCAAIWAVAWLLGKRWRRWPAFAMGLPFFLVALFFFFESFSVLLPANY